MDFFEFVTVAMVFVFVLIIVKMSLKHAERIEKIKRGYSLEDKPLTDSTGYVDTRDGNRLQ